MRVCLPLALLLLLLPSCRADRGGDRAGPPPARSAGDDDDAGDEAEDDDGAEDEDLTRIADRPAPLPSTESGPFDLPAAPRDGDAIATADPRTGLTWISLPGRKYALSKEEVTVAQYARCVEAGACPTDKVDGIYWLEQPFKKDARCNWKQPGKERHPMNCVGWDDADAFCRWAGGRLPTKAEWVEEASDGGDRTFPWGDQDPSCERANFNDWRTSGSSGREGCGSGATAEVCSRPGGNSVHGLCDMGGNVWEWTNTQEFRQIPPKINMGGSFENSGDKLDAEFEMVNPVWFRNYTVGLRCMRALLGGAPIPKGALPESDVAVPAGSPPDSVAGPDADVAGGTLSKEDYPLLEGELRCAEKHFAGDQAAIDRAYRAILGRWGARRDWLDEVRVIVKNDKSYVDKIETDTQVRMRQVCPDGKLKPELLEGL